MRALVLFSSWSFQAVGLGELWLCADAEVEVEELHLDARAA